MAQFTTETIMILSVSAFLTSMLSAVLGMGGGISLLAVMMYFFPPSVLIPVHGVVQFFSNGFRVVLNLRHLVWSIFIPLVIGGVLGAALGSQVVLKIPQNVYQPLLALFILFMTWKPKSSRAYKAFKLKFYLVGFLSHFLSLVFGATGPFLAPFFLKSRLSRHQIIATKAAAQWTGHLFKIIVFMSLGVALGKYLEIILIMIACVFLGTFVGKRILHKVPEKLFIVLFKLLISLLCLQMLLKAWVSS